MHEARSPSWQISQVCLRAGLLGKPADLLRSERIANSERYLDTAKANNQRAEDKTEELRQLNRSIFKPVVVWNKVCLFSLY